MENPRFAWDGRKDKANQRKHGIPFVEAIDVFYDERALVYHDPDHSEEEERFLILGMSRKCRVLVICHCFRENDLVIRIISARKADKFEEAAYMEANR